MSEENVEVVRRMHEAWSRTPSEPPMEFFDPAVEWLTRWPGLESVYRGHAGVRRWAQEVVEPMAMEIDLREVRSIDEDRVFAEYHAQGTGRESGAAVEMDIFDVLRLRGGRIVRRDTFYERSEALEAAGLSE